MASIFTDVNPIELRLMRMACAVRGDFLGGCKIENVAKLFDIEQVIGSVSDRVTTQ